MISEPPNRGVFSLRRMLAGSIGFKSKSQVPPLVDSEALNVEKTRIPTLTLVTLNFEHKIGGYCHTPAY
jgi:hypothetical protein